MSKRKKNPHWGSTLDDFLAEEGIREAAKAEAVTRVVAWQLSEEMKRQGITKAHLSGADAHQPRPGRSYPQGERQCDDRDVATGRRTRRAAIAA